MWELTHAQLQDANLQDTDLSHAELRGAKLAGANFQGADIDSAKFDSGAEPQVEEPNDSDDDRDDVASEPPGETAKFATRFRASRRIFSASGGGGVEISGRKVSVKAPRVVTDSQRARLQLINEQRPRTVPSGWLMWTQTGHVFLVLFCCGVGAGLSWFLVNETNHGQYGRPAPISWLCLVGIPWIVGGLLLRSLAKLTEGRRTDSA